MNKQLLMALVNLSSEQEVPLQMVTVILPIPLIRMK